jgi:general secretion pathway protein F
MPKFRYMAMDAGGKSVRGVIEAVSAAAVADRLHNQGQFLVEANEVGRNGQLFDILHADLALERRPSKSAIAHFTRELSVMLSAGQDIDGALRFLVQNSEDKRVRGLLEALRNQVRGGKSLTFALSEHKNVFPRLYISLVQAGEASGKLAETLARLADLLERDVRLTAQIRSALTYPVLLVVMAVATIAFLLTYVLPQFAPIFQQAGTKLPAATRVLLGVGDVVRNDGGWIALGALGAFLVVYRLMREPEIKVRIERLLLHVPVVGMLIRRAQAARFTRTLGTLLRNGVGLVSALGIARGVLGNLVASRIVDAATGQVRAGKRLSLALAAGGFFPFQTVHLLQLGEETGRLGEMALRAADIHDDQVHQSVQRIVSLMVPVITVVMGLVVAGIIGSLLVAMLSLNDLAV